MNLPEPLSEVEERILAAGVAELREQVLLFRKQQHKGKAMLVIVLNPRVCDQHQRFETQRGGGNGR